MSLPLNPTTRRFKSFCDTNNEIADRSDTRSGRIPDDLNNSIMTSANDSRPYSSDGKLQCCCGRPECAYLENNNTILGGIERDLETAAKLGQALLNRHESYVNESQQEHERLSNYISELEKERTTLQTTNEKIVEENRQLLTQLESVNTSLKDSDSHVKSLEALLRECEVEVRRLNGLSRRTEELELKILDLEKERLIISRQAEDGQEETRSTIKRWKESEVKVRQLESEVVRIEWEARRDKERYEEIIARLERERVFERELGGAEGRLKGAAALRGLNGKGKDSNVVSHFVRDILRDNANLQAGIVELRELLQTSNEEVQSLREQVLEHQPVNDGVQSLYRSVPLSDQMGWTQSTANVQQSVHVHHHYHAKLGKKDRPPTIRRSSRKRGIVGTTMLPSTPESSVPSTPVVAPHRFVSSPTLPISLHQPQSMRNRWSVHSSATASSMASSFPSSPRSNFEQPSSMFDMLEAGEESSRPTSPESVGLATSPLKLNRTYDFEAGLPDHQEETDADHPLGVADEVQDILHQEQEEGTNPPTTTMPDHFDSQQLTPKPSRLLIAEDDSARSHEPEPPDLNSSNSVAYHVPELGPPKIVVEEHALDSEMQGQSPVNELVDSPTSIEDETMEIRPNLHRSSSHDSLVSISGMDIHIAKRPATSTSQSSSLPRGNKAYFAVSPSAARRMPSAQALVTVTEYTALSSMRSYSSGPSNTHTRHPMPTRSVSSSVAALNGIRGLSAPAQDEQPSPAGGFTRLVGGWVRGKWGIAPVKSNVDLRSSAASVSTTSSTDSNSATAAIPFFMGRPPGINQKGPIPGLKAPSKITTVQVTKVDEEGLKASLAD